MTDLIIPRVIFKGIPINHKRARVRQALLLSLIDRYRGRDAFLPNLCDLVTIMDEEPQKIGTKTKYHLIDNHLKYAFF